MIRIENGKYILEGVLTEFEEKTRNRPYYTEETFKKHLKDLETRMRKEQREKLLKKLKKVKNKDV